MLIFKSLFCTDLSPNTLYRKCIKFAPKKGGSSDPLDPPPFPTPLGWGEGAQKFQIDDFPIL